MVSDVCMAPQSVEIRRDQSFHDKYDLLEEIGTGAFGVVHRCVERATGQVWAAKIVHTHGEPEREAARREIRTMSDLRYPSLIHLHDAFENDTETVMVYEYMSGGELFEKLSDDRCRMTEEEASRYIKQVCAALRHMHRMNYVHLDLKPENIMFKARESESLKLIDFGLAAKLDPSNPVKVTTGTAEFAAPEVVLGEPVGSYTDMWSVGVLAYILLSGLSPFGGENDDETLRHVRHCDWNMDDAAFCQVSASAKDFITQLLRMEPRRRMTVDDALTHSWLTAVRGDPTEPASYDKCSATSTPSSQPANCSSLRRIHDAAVEASASNAPRFLVRPFNATCTEGQACTLYCKLAAGTSAPRVTWFRDGARIHPDDVRFSRRDDADPYDCSLTVGRARMEDRGEYVVRAENTYGWREAAVTLNVLKAASTIADFKRNTDAAAAHQGNSAVTLPPPLRSTCCARRKTLTAVADDATAKSFEEPRSAPLFTFHLRPRLIQKGYSCKLLCTVNGHPTPTVEWLKDGATVDADRFLTRYKSGVCTLEIYNARVADAGTYTCCATNPLGVDRTECLIAVQTRDAAATATTSLAPETHLAADKAERSLLERSKSYVAT